MAFSIVNQQIRLRLSRTAEEVIAYDMGIFEEKSRAAFINNVLSNFYEDANSSIGRKMMQYKEELLGVKGCNESDVFYKSLVAQEKKRLMDLADSYDKPEKNANSDPIRLRDELFEYLTESGANTEDKYYLSIPKYCRAMMEEYARLPYTARELIYFKKEIVAPINDAIRNGYQLFLTTGLRNNDSAYHSSYFFVPYKLMTDPLSTSNYLTGYSYRADQGKRDKKMCSFKLSKLIRVKKETSRSAFLSKDDIADIQEAIEQKGVMFLIADSREDVVVRLTEAGRNMFKTQIHMRPVPTKIDENEYTFSCSTVQARNYFFKFGKDVEVIKPEFLREQFIQEYNNALKAYD